MAGEPTHIRGDTFRVFGQFTGGDYTGWVGESMVRNDADDAFLSSLDFTWIDATQGSFMVEILDTSNWPANKFVIFDVQIQNISGERRSSGLVKILVDRDVTYANLA